jgi:hypothetical protein
MLSGFKHFFSKIMNNNISAIGENVVTISAKKGIEKVDADEVIVDSQAKRSKTDENTTILENKSEENRVKKRKYALLIGYCGEGYFGLQR